MNNTGGFFMAIICEQVYRELSLSGANQSPNSIEQSYIVIGLSDEFEARKLVLEKSPEYIEGCQRDNVSLERHEGQAMYFSVTYNGLEGSLKTGSETRISMDFTIQRYQKENSTTSDIHGFYKGLAKKVQVSMPHIRKSITKTMSYSDLSISWERKISELAGCVNNSNFLGYEKGEMLFLGCSYSGVKAMSSSFDVTYNFAISHNEKNIWVGVQESGKEIRVNKSGWQFIAGERGYKLGTTGTFEYWKHVYLGTVYQYGDFKKLGI